MPPLFDAHVRLVPRNGALDELLRVMDATGIEGAVASPGGSVDLASLSRQLIEGGGVTASADNSFVLAAAAASGGRISPRYFANPHDGEAEYRAEGQAYVGVEISPAVHGLPLLDERFGGFIDAAADFGHSIYTVCLSRPGARVSSLVELARRHRHTTFVLGHCGVGNIDFFGLSLVADEPNIIVETSGGYSSVLRSALDQLGSARVMFGSEYPLQHPSVELAKFATIDLSEADADAVLRLNAQNLFNLPGVTTR